MTGRKAPLKSTSLVHWINRMDAQIRFYTCTALALLIGFIIASSNPMPVAVAGTWLAFSMSELLFSWVTILSSHPIEMKKIAKLQDANRSLIFILVLTASLVSLFAVIDLLQSTSGSTTSIIVSFASVFSAWWLVHTTFTFHYAHLYYSQSKDAEGPHERFGGLEFPKESQPDYIDFTYFSFVIGMTFQVSDVEISSRKIRRLALLHGILSFIFNTFILALSINVIFTIIQLQNP